MKIEHKRKRLKHYLIFGTLWLLLGIAAIIYDASNVFNYGYLLIGVMYFTVYLFEKNK